VAVGGDGTVNLVASKIILSDISLGIIPAGSANGLAFNLNIPDEFEAALRNILTGSVTLMDVLCINDKYYCLHLSDIGLNARIVKNFEEEGSRGMWGYIKQVFKQVLFNRTVFTCEILANDIRKTIKAEMVVIANAAKYGTGLAINPEGNLFDGKFELVIIRPVSWMMLIVTLFNLLTGKLKKMRNVTIISSTAARIKLKKQQVIHIDGEIVEGIGEMDIKIIPAALKILTV